MRVAIMQPYFLPYIGYLQLINAVDTFVVYDNIQYTRKGWIACIQACKNSISGQYTSLMWEQIEVTGLRRRWSTFWMRITRCSSLSRRF